MLGENLELTKLTFHHVGLLVDSIESSIIHYSELFSKENISKVYLVDSQKVKVCFVKVSDGTFIELVEPMGEESVVFKLLKKRISYYHIAYKVTDIIATVNKLELLNYKALEYFNSEAFEGKRCIFLYTPDAHLVELIEQ